MRRIQKELAMPHAERCGMSEWYSSVVERLLLEVGQSSSESVPQSSRNITTRISEKRGGRVLMFALPFKQGEGIEE